MKSQITSSAFWQLFKAPPTHGVVALEVLRHRCLLGFTALDAALYSYWESSVVSEWNEILTLVDATLHSSSSDETLDRLSALAGPGFKKSQLVATLGFLGTAGEAPRFAPNFIDFAAYLLLRRDADCLPLVHQLCEAHRCRMSALTSGGPWSELQAHRALKVIEETAESLCALGRNFEEVFRSKLHTDSLQKPASAA